MKILVANIDYESQTLLIRFESNEDVRAAYERVTKDPKPPTLTNLFKVEDTHSAIIALYRTLTGAYLWKNHEKIQAVNLRDAKEAVEKICGEPLRY